MREIFFVYVARSCELLHLSNVTFKKIRKFKNVAFEIFPTSFIRSMFHSKLIFYVVFSYYSKALISICADYS